MKEWNYAWTEREEEGREEASGGEREQRREVEELLREDRRRKGDREGGRDTSREVPWRTLAKILYTVPRTTHNAALAIETLALKIKNSEPV